MWGKKGNYEAHETLKDYKHFGMPKMSDAREGAGRERQGSGNKGSSIVNGNLLKVNFQLVYNYISNVQLHFIRKV